MPELPEVEIVTNELKEKILSTKIESVFYSGKKFKRPVESVYLAGNQNIKKIYRRNKYIILELDDFWLVFHLGMTGNLFYSPIEKKGKHTHLIFKLSDKHYLIFDDPRRFGSIDLFEKNKIPNYLEIPLFSKLGLEPLSENFTLDSFSNFFSLKINIKKFLMDSQYVCGIGNIYANEILFLSNISPLKNINTLNKKQISLLFSNITMVLNKAISLGGSSISDFVHTNGVKGEMQNFYYVYGKKEHNCKLCSSKIEKIQQFGRGTYFCPTCQK